jgi:hypothetical protein
MNELFLIALLLTASPQSAMGSGVKVSGRVTPLGSPAAPGMGRVTSRVRPGSYLPGRRTHALLFVAVLPYSARSPVADAVAFARWPYRALRPSSSRSAGRMRSLKERETDFHHGLLGLGLYISNEVIHRHRGQIEVRSTAVEGTTFRVVLPLEAIGDSDDQGTLRK